MNQLAAACHIFDNLFNSLNKHNTVGKLVIIITMMVMMADIRVPYMLYANIFLLYSNSMAWMWQDTTGRFGGRFFAEPVSCVFSKVLSNQYAKIPVNIIYKN